MCEGRTVLIDYLFFSTDDMSFGVKVQNLVEALLYCNENFLIGTFGFTTNYSEIKFLEENDAVMFKMVFIDSAHPS
jgi:hypothetical protein